MAKVGGFGQQQSVGRRERETEVESWILIASRAFKYGYAPCIIYPRRFLAMTVSLKLTPIVNYLSLDYRRSICPRLLSPLFLRIKFGAIFPPPCREPLQFFFFFLTRIVLERRRLLQGDCSRKGQVVNSPFNRVSRFRGVESLSFQRLPLIKISLK